MRTAVYLLILGMVTTGGMANPSGGGQVIPLDGSVTSFEPVANPNEFDLPAYFESLHPDAPRWYQHVHTLSNPWMEGRAPGSRGDELALEYISFHLNRSGLNPAFEGTSTEPEWQQPFTFSLRGQAPEVQRAALNMGPHRFNLDEDFSVLWPSASADVKLPLSTAGYGIDSGPNGFSSFSDEDDFTGRAVLLLRYEPLTEDAQSQWSDSGYSPHAAIRAKLDALCDRGASAVLLVNPIGTDDALMTIGGSRGFGARRDIPVLHVSRATADQLIKQASWSKASLESVQQQADAGQSGVTHFPDWRKCIITTDLQFPSYQTSNVGGILPGQGDLKDEWVIIGGHYDHLGYGYTGSRTPNDARIHPGADDNASGIATMLILADRLSKATNGDLEPRRSAMFIGFGGEEAGLHGSAHFVKNAPIDLDQTSMMLNLDMMGRIRGRTVAVGGTGTAAEFDDMLPRLVEPTGLTVMATPSGLGPSDHSNFYRADVPVLFVFSGLHDDYHTPADVAWRVNPEGTTRIIDLCESILLDAMQRSDLLTFTESTANTPARRDTGASVRLGIMPSYTEASGKGVLIDGVTSGTSADDAGLQEGDLITRWDETDITGGRDLMTTLRRHAPGDTVVLKVVRDGTTIEVPVTLKGRN